jgi:TRAP-type C4-dicarboxylate transport system permease small subunit
VLGGILGLVAAATVVGFVLVARAGGDVASQILVIHLIQIAAGSVIGILCLFVGAAMCWFGITGAFDAEARTASLALTARSTHVGIVLLIGGVLLVAISLHKSVSAKETILEPKLEKAEQEARMANERAEEAKRRLEKLEALEKKIRPNWRG